MPQDELTPFMLASELMMALRSEFMKIGRGTCLEGPVAPQATITVVTVRNDRLDYELRPEYFAPRFILPVAASIANNLSDRYPVGGGAIPFRWFDGPDRDPVSASVHDSKMGLAVRCVKAFHVGDEKMEEGWYTTFSVAHGR